MSYIDNLTNDLFEKIFNIRCDDIENEIILLNKKLKKLKKKLKPLLIEYLDVDEDEEALCIVYEDVIYSMSNYLYNNIDDDNYIILINLFSDHFSEEAGKDYISKKMFKPTYFDILVKASKSVKTIKDYSHVFLEGLSPISHNKLYNYTGIKPKKNINYYEFIMGS